MCGTPEYYFEKKWAGAENIGRLIEHKEVEFRENSLSISFGESFTMLTDAVREVIFSHNELRAALFDSKLSEDEFHRAMSALEWRMSEAQYQIAKIAEDLKSTRNSIASRFHGDGL